jgi:ABC-2 type transport system permease protein
MSSTAIIAKREFRSYFDSPIAYVVVCLSLIVVGWFVFRDFWTINRATLGPLFTYIPWALVLLIVPAVTMRLFAEEKRTGTIELLITMPVRDVDVVLGKFLATLGLVAVLLLLTAPYAFMVNNLGNLDFGPVWVGYVGLLLFGAAAIAIGLFFSSITENQIVAFMLTWITLLVLWILDYLGAAFSGVIGDIFSFISWQRRMTPFARGLLDLRNVVYFLSVAGFFLMLTVRSLESRKWK